MSVTLTQEEQAVLAAFRNMPTFRQATALSLLTDLSRLSDTERPDYIAPTPLPASVPGKAALSAERDDYIRQAYEGGLSTRAIGERLGIDHTAVHRTLKRLGVPGRTCGWSHPR